jgi:hypothetical protein
MRRFTGTVEDDIAKPQLKSAPYQGAELVGNTTITRSGGTDT